MFAICSHASWRVEQRLRNEPSWPIRSSLRRNPARRRTSAPPWAPATATFSPAEGHLLDLLEPEEVVPAWKRWSPILLRPEGLYGTRPAGGSKGGNKAAKLRAIREALRTAERVWLATDCDREGQLIGQEILEHYDYRGQVMRVLFTAQDAADHPRRLRPGQAECRVCPALRRRRRAPAGRPDLQPLAHPHRDRHSRAWRTPR